MELGGPHTVALVRRDRMRPRHAPRALVRMVVDALGVPARRCERRNGSVYIESVLDAEFECLTCEREPQGPMPAGRHGSPMVSVSTVRGAPSSGSTASPSTVTTSENLQSPCTVNERASRREGTNSTRASKSGSNA